MTIDVSMVRAESLERLIVETRLLFRSLRGASSRVRLGGDETAARRSVLIDLARGGPRTVPALAASRHISRQATQSLINALAADGLVARRPNPEHRRSWLWHATPWGRERAGHLRERERQVLGGLDGAPEADRLDAASKVLAEMRVLLDDLGI